MKKLLLIYLFFTTSLVAEDGIPYRLTTYNDLKDLEKISFSLTGRPLKKSLKQSYMLGEMTQEEIIDSLIQSDDFVNNFAKYWSAAMGILSKQSMMDMMIKGTSTNMVSALSSAVSFGLPRDTDAVNNNPNSPDSSRNAIANLETRIQQTKDRTGSIRFSLKKCGDEVWILVGYLSANDFDEANSVVNYGRYINNVPASLPKASLFPGVTGNDLAQARLNRSKQAHKELVDLYHQLVLPSCTDSLPHTTAIKPFWDKSGKRKYRASKYLTDNKRCGIDMSKCHSNAQTPYLRGIEEDSTLEPGRIIGKTVAEGLSFKSILTTPNTVMTGRLAHFLTTKIPDNVWTSNFPKGKYPDKNPKYTSANPENKELFWVNRGDHHSGVLTTYAYQMVTNGRRAKANRVFETFTCSQFVVADDVLPDPNDSNEDLRQRTYCANCHRTLEPMASFFNKWPDTGRVNYEFYDDASIDDRGLFRGTEGKGVKDFGALIASSPTFDSCTIKRSFDFLHGRPMTKSEESILIPHYVKIFQESGENLAKVLKHMLNAREFTGRHQE